MALHAPTRRIEAEAPFLAPHEEQYAMLAEHLGLDHDTLMAVATHYASDALDSLPEQKEGKLYRWLRQRAA